MCRVEITTPALQEVREAPDGASLAVPAAVNGRMAAVGSPQRPRFCLASCERCMAAGYKTAIRRHQSCHHSARNSSTSPFRLAPIHPHVPTPRHFCLFAPTTYISPSLPLDFLLLLYTIPLLNNLDPTPQLSVLLEYSLLTKHQHPVVITQLSCCQNAFRQHLLRHLDIVLPRIRRVFSDIRKEHRRRQ